MEWKSLAMSCMCLLPAASGGKHKVVVESLSTTSQPTPGRQNYCRVELLTE